MLLPRSPPAEEEEGKEEEDGGPRAVLAALADFFAKQPQCSAAAQTAAGKDSVSPSHAGGTGTGHDGGAMGGAGAQPAHEAAHCARTAESGSLHAVGFDATREAQSSTGRASGPMPAQPGGAGGGGASAQ